MESQPKRQWGTLSTARAVLRALECIAQHPHGLSAEDVASALGESLSSSYRLLNTLCEESFAEKVSGSTLYRLGAKALVLSRDMRLARHPALDIPAADVVADLANRTRERAYFALIDGDEIVVTAVKEMRNSPPIPGLGKSIDDKRHALAIGKLFLSHCSEVKQAEYMDRYGLQPFTPKTMTSTLALTGQLATIRTRGMAFDQEEFAEGFCCIAAPILGDEGQVIAAVGISVPETRFQALRYELARRVILVASSYSSPTGDPLNKAGDPDLD